MPTPGSKNKQRPRPSRRRYIDVPEGFDASGYLMRGWYGDSTDQRERIYPPTTKRTPVRRKRTTREGASSNTNKPRAKSRRKAY